LQQFPEPVKPLARLHPALSLSPAGIPYIFTKFLVSTFLRQGGMHVELAIEKRLLGLQLEEVF
jgi:hypothetical protein